MSDQCYHGHTHCRGPSKTCGSFFSSVSNTSRSSRKADWRMTCEWCAVMLCKIELVKVMAGCLDAVVFFRVGRMISSCCGIFQGRVDAIFMPLFGFKLFLHEDIIPITFWRAWHHKQSHVPKPATTPTFQVNRLPLSGEASGEVACTSGASSGVISCGAFPATAN